MKKPEKKTPTAFRHLQYNLACEEWEAYHKEETMRMLRETKAKLIASLPVVHHIIVDTIYDDIITLIK